MNNDETSEMINNLRWMDRSITNSAANLIEQQAERIEKLVKYSRRLEDMCDELLAHCDKENGECSICSAIVCPYNCPMHFHHDGCPSCSNDDATIEKEQG